MRILPCEWLDSLVLRPSCVLQPAAATHTLPHPSETACFQLEDEKVCVPLCDPRQCAATCPIQEMVLDEMKKVYGNDEVVGLVVPRSTVSKTMPSQPLRPALTIFPCF